MKIAIAICSGLLGPKVLRALGRAFRHLGHDVFEYDGQSLDPPKSGKPDLHVCYNLATRWIPPDVQSIQVWGEDPRLDDVIMNSVIQRQKDMDLAFLADGGWLAGAVEDEGLYAGHHVQFGTDTLIEPSSMFDHEKHSMGIFGNAYPQRIAELAILVNGGLDLAIWGHGWEHVPMLSKLRRGVIEREEDLLSAMNSCEVVGVLPRHGGSLPWSYWQAIGSRAAVSTGMQDILCGVCTPPGRADVKRSMIDVANDILKITTKHMEGHANRVVTHIEVDDPFAEITIRFPNEGDVDTFDISAKHTDNLNQDAIPIILRRIANGIENERLGNGLAKCMNVDDGKSA